MSWDDTVGAPGCAVWGGTGPAHTSFSHGPFDTWRLYFCGLAVPPALEPDRGSSGEAAPSLHQEAPDQAVLPSRALLPLPQLGQAWPLGLGVS